MTAAVFLRIDRYRFGPLKALLFDKDGTMARSEGFLLGQAQARIAACLRHVEAARQPRLRALLLAAYGLVDPGGSSGWQLDPGGAAAVASAAENRVSTATCLAQVGLAWSDAWAAACSAHHEARASRTRNAQDPARDRARFTPPLPGVAELLRRAARHNVPCGVVSGDSRDGIRAFLDHWDLLPMVAAWRGADQAPPKPAPEAALALCSAMGVAPQHCALFGDSGHDLAMARAAGIGAVVGYVGGWSTAPGLQGFDARLAHWDHLDLASPQVVDGA